MKPTLLEIKRSSTVTITTREIAEQARLAVADVFTVETGGYCSQETVERVLEAFNQLSGLNVGVGDIVVRNTY